MASAMPLTNSQRNNALADPASLMASSFPRQSEMAVLDDAGDDRHHGERQRQEHLPAEPHQLVVAITRHDRLDHGEHEKEEKRLEREPDHARNPCERRIWHRRQPAAEEFLGGWL